MKLKLVRSLVLLSSLAMHSNAQVSNSTLSPQQFKYSLHREFNTEYLLYVPSEYDPKSTKVWPLMLFLHGAGERGADLKRVAIHGPMSLAKQGTNFPFIIAAPQCPENARWHSETLIPLLDKLATSLKVDTNRIYLTGLSMGGYGTWDLGVTHPGRFAAIAPICGGGSVLDVLLAGYGKPANPLTSLPVWAFHGAKDPVVPLEESERMINALKKAGNRDAKLTVYPEAQHNSWTETYANSKLYDWMLSHSLTDAARRGK